MTGDAIKVTMGNRELLWEVEFNDVEGNTIASVFILQASTPDKKDIHDALEYDGYSETEIKDLLADGLMSVMPAWGWRRG